MKPNILKTITGGIVATLVMSIVMFVAPFMGLPKMSPPEMLSSMLSIPIAIGWVMHFMIGIVFAIVYSQFFKSWLHKIKGKVLQGLTYGMAVFVFAQLMTLIIGAMMPMPKMEGSIILLMAGSLIGHLIYGLMVALIIAEKRPSLSLA